MHEKFMTRAIEIAGESVDTPGTLPYGAVVVLDGEIIGEGLNRCAAASDPTSHGGSIVAGCPTVMIGG